MNLRPVHARTLREVAEVVAIVLAGAWALYVFVYENRIAPAFAPVAPSFSIALRHVGNDGNLAVIRLDEAIRNPGSTVVGFLGYSVTVLGSNVVARASPRPANHQPFVDTLEAYYTFTQPVPVFREAFVTAAGDPNSGKGLFVEPGQTTAFARELYVPLRRFDRLTVWIVARYTKGFTFVPTTLVIEKSGIPAFPTRGNAETYEISQPMAELDLRSE
ncbi:MAG TPA: hypothetical protein VMF61_06515 [Candidatus Acidoferrales bacterium]|nr:hypothetical protein [Candidatus Acidoferrales bacterium]